MGIKQEIEHTKTLLNQGVDLLLLRLQVINLDLAEQAENAFRTLLALLFSAVLLFVALFAALFGLNRLLDDATAVKVFFIAAAAASEGWAQKAAFSAARGKSRWALIAAWLAWHFMRRKG